MNLIIDKSQVSKHIQSFTEETTYKPEVDNEYVPKGNSTAISGIASSVFTVNEACKEDENSHQKRWSMIRETPILPKT